MSRGVQNKRLAMFDKQVSSSSATLQYHIRYHEYSRMTFWPLHVHVYSKLLNTQILVFLGTIVPVPRPSGMFRTRMCSLHDFISIS